MHDKRPVKLNVGYNLAMKPKLWFAQAICVLSLTVFLHAQTPAPDLEAVLRKDLMGKQLVLRNFSAASVVNASWNSETATTDRPLSHIFAATIVSNLKINGSLVEIEGTRRTIVRDNAGNLALSPTAIPVTYRFTLVGDPASALATLRNGLFFPSISDALEDVPGKFQPVAFHKPNAAKSSGPPPSACDCADQNDTCDISSNRIFNSSGEPPKGLKPPKVLSSVAAEYSSEAKDKHFSGDVEMGLVVDETGAIADEWLMDSVGLGLDEQAAIAASKYKFAPATCHDQPVAVTVYVEVNFQIY